MSQSTVCRSRLTVLKGGESTHFVFLDLRKNGSTYSVTIHRISSGEIDKELSGI